MQKERVQGMKAVSEDGEGGGSTEGIQRGRRTELILEADMRWIDEQQRTKGFGKRQRSNTGGDTNEWKAAC